MRLTRTIVAALALLALAPACAAADGLPDPMTRGTYAVAKTDQYIAGTVNLQEPNAAGGGLTTSNSAATVQVRGSMYLPGDRTTPAPVIVLVHGNHSSCDSGSAPNCTVFKRNDRGYAYLAENLASWGYAVFSVDQDQLMYYQDGQFGKGMHQRRLMIAATLDALYKANAEGLGPLSADNTIGDTLVGKLDFTKIGLMGHSRGGDAVTSFIDYNRTRPEPGRRYDLAGVISLAPVDYERRAPYGTPYMTVLPDCDGDVSNLQGARFFERSQYVVADDPFPKIQVSVLGANHNYFNSVWSADNDDASGQLLDPACGMNAPTSIRLTGGTTPTTYGSGPNAYQASTYTFANRGDGDPALMGDQNKIGLAVMSSFFRRYVGGETAFQPYLTGELSATGDGKQIPASACPASTSGTRIACDEYVTDSYFAPAGEREDVIGPDTDTPLTTSALGTSLTASGFSNPFPADGGVVPVPATTASGVDWCNPEPLHFNPSGLGQVGVTEATKPCPMPSDDAVGGRSSNRENAPVNHSYGMQLALAWDDPVASTGRPATLSTRIPAADGDVSDKKALALAADVNFFDARNAARAGDVPWNPALTSQDFTIALTDADGHEGTVAAGSTRYGHALQQTTGNTNARVHIVLDQIRVPLGDFAAQGVDLAKVRKLELRFGELGKPATGSIQLADVRFQEATGAVRTASTADAIARTPRSGRSPSNPDVIGISGSTTVSSKTACADTAAPAVRLASLRPVRGRLILKGTARDRGCAATAAKSATKGKVASVQVTLSTASGARCRFVKGDATLSAPLACSARVALVATGTTAWSLKLRKALPRGSYRVRVTAYDGAGNVTRTKARRLRVA